MTASIAKEHELRSRFARGIIQGIDTHAAPELSLTPPAQRTIVQFWDDSRRLPDDVAECIQSWQSLTELGFRTLVFDDNGASKFISNCLGLRHARAFAKCYHPAMRADLFRLCYILTEGGCYVDADDVYSGRPIDHLFFDGRLKIQSLCYDRTTDTMVPRADYASHGADSSSWIYYFNNNPLIAGAGNPIVRRALSNAITAIECSETDTLPEIQSTTGPGNLTRTIVDLARENDAVLNEMMVIADWDDIATSRWPLSYRQDSRNWRLSNRKRYTAQGRERK